MKPKSYQFACDRRVSLSILLFVFASHNYLLAQPKPDPIKGYDKASYNTAEAGKFMKNWLVAGPIAVSAKDSNPDMAMQEKVFKQDLLSSAGINGVKPDVPLTISGKTLPWKRISSGEDVVSLNRVFGDKDQDHVYAYAVAEIKADKPSRMILGVGSDDAIKIWVNGKLIHENWSPRGITKDDDIVPIQLVKGSNQILLKVQDIELGWAFVIRLMDKQTLGMEMAKAASIGDIEKMELLIKTGADINVKNGAGVTPLAAAKLAGREEAVQLLMKNGAKDEMVPPGEALVDSYYSSLKNKEASGIAIRVSREGKLLYEKGFGYADIKGRKLVTPDTKFRIGSVTKQFTAAAILKLQEDNLLTVSDKLSKYISDFPRGDEVTIHHLLTHTSGIHSYTSKPDFFDRVTKTINEDSLIQYFKNDKFDFNPGESFLYNNSGYFLLGYIIQKVSGKTYADYLRQSFFDPLGMKNTGVHFAGIKLENEAGGYEYKDGKPAEALNWDMSWAGAAGNLYSTLQDLDTWNHALHSGKVIKEPSLKAAVTTVALSNGTKPSSNYGYGLMTSKYRGLDNVQHSGGLHGFISQLVYYPKQKLSIVMLSNSSNPEVPFDPNKVAEAFLWNEMEKQASNIAKVVSVDSLNLYTGRYDFTNGAVMQISREGNKLFAQLSGQGRFEIFPNSPSEFFWKVVDAKIKFIKNDSGLVSHAIFRQNGQELNVKKLKEETIVKIDPSLYRKYTGRYKYINDIVVTISQEENKLFAQPTGQSKLEMFAISETEFILKEINARIRFNEEGGKVTRLMLTLNGATSELPRME